MLNPWKKAMLCLVAMKTASIYKKKLSMTSLGRLYQAEMAYVFMFRPKYLYLIRLQNIRRNVIIFLN